MKLLITIWEELFAVFVDDGAFAFAILTWLAGAWVCITLVQFPRDLEAILLFLGFACLLAESVLRAARSRL